MVQQNYFSHVRDGQGTRRTLRDLLKKSGSWVAAAAVAWYFLQPDPKAIIKLGKNDLGKTNASEFMLLQTETNAKVKENDRSKLPQRIDKESMTSKAVRYKSDSLDERMDFVSKSKNIVNERGILSSTHHEETVELDRWLQEHGNPSAEELSDRRRNREMSHP